jgi:hypothetical protein
LEDQLINLGFGKFKNSIWERVGDNSKLSITCFLPKDNDENFSVYAESIDKTYWTNEIFDNESDTLAYIKILMSKVPYMSKIDILFSCWDPEENTKILDYFNNKFCEEFAIIKNEYNVKGM